MSATAPRVPAKIRMVTITLDQDQPLFFSGDMITVYPRPKPNQA